VRDVSLWNEVLGVEKTVFESVEYDQEHDLLVARVRPTKRARGRCGLCHRPCPGSDGGDGRRPWRALDLGTVKAVLEADAPRVSCRSHGVVVAAVPWARHGTGHTYAFDDTMAWLTVRSSKTAVRELMRVAWRTVGSIITRVSSDAMARTDRFANLSRIGIDEISYMRGSAT
jgi:transposase